jgi:hypothetical protein
VARRKTLENGLYPKLCFEMSGCTECAPLRKEIIPSVWLKIGSSSSYPFLISLRSICLVPAFLSVARAFSLCVMLFLPCHELTPHH